MRSTEPDLTPMQRRILVQVFETDQARHCLFLGGGTGLACFYLHHRWSDDIDLFCLDRDEFEEMARIVRDAATRQRLRIENEQNQRGHTRLILSGDPHPDHRLERIDVVMSTRKPLRSPQSWQDGIVVASLADLAAAKLNAVCGRDDLKDYVDIYALNLDSRIDLGDILDLMPGTYPGYSSLQLAEELRSIGELEVQFHNLSRHYLCRNWSFDDLRRFCQRLAYTIDRRLPEPRTE